MAKAKSTGNNNSRASQQGLLSPKRARHDVFGLFATEAARLSGKPMAFIVLAAFILVWAAAGPLFHFSETWFLFINTAGTIVTVLFVFLIQNTQNREGAALQAKLDELIRATREAHNDLVGLERLPEEAVEKIRKELVDEAQQQIG